MHPRHTTMLAMCQFRNRGMRIRVGEEKGEHLEDARGVYTVSVRIHFINGALPDETARLPT